MSIFADDNFLFEGLSGLKSGFKINHKKRVQRGVSKLPIMEGALFFI